MTKPDSLKSQIHCAHTELVDVDSLIPHPRNPNTHSEDQIRLLAKIIKYQGWRAPITVSNRSGFIVRGHGRLMAAKVLELKKVPVDRQDYETEADEWADLIADNRLSELSVIDNPSLKDLLTELDTGEFDMEFTGFDEAALEDLMTQFHTDEIVEDEAPEPPDDPTTKPGDLYQLGPHRLMCGDSTVITDVERLMDGRKADMVFTDPPYGVSYVGKTKEALTIKNDSHADMYGWLCDVFRTMWTVMTDGASFYVCCPPGSSIHRAFWNALEDSELPVRQGLVWLKDSMVLGHSDYHYKHEPILYGWKAGKKYFTSDRTQVSVFDIPRPKRSEDHPTMKPVELPAMAIRNSSKDKGTIFDPFLGSGTTLIAADQLNRICYGMEIDPKYCDVIIERYRRFKELPNGWWPELDD